MTVTFQLLEVPGVETKAWALKGDMICHHMPVPYILLARTVLLVL